MIIMKRLMLTVCSVVVLVGCNEKENANEIQPSVVLEQHKIVAIEGNEIYGENVSGSGEGIYYMSKDFEDMGISEIAIGDVVEIGWSKENFVNEDWDIYSLELVE
jgi:hypothetical protein